MNLYISNFDTLLKLYNIELYIQKYIKQFKLIKKYKNLHYIICKKDKIIDVNNINISIYNIVYNNNKYVPIIFII